MTNNFFCSCTNVYDPSHLHVFSFTSINIRMDFFLKNDELNLTISKSLLLLCTEPMRISNRC